MERSIAVACCIAALAGIAPSAHAEAGNVQKVCVIPNGSAKEGWSLIPVPEWAAASLCEAMRNALPGGGEGRDTKLGCMVGPNESDFDANTFHIVGTNSGNPCHWPFVAN